MRTDLRNRLQSLLAELHTDDTTTLSVWKAWNDGEITLEKGGAVYGCRNLHTMEPSLVWLRRLDDDGGWEPLPVLPRYNADSGYSYAIVATKRDAYRVRSAIREILRG